MAAGGACPAEGVPALRHHCIHLVGEADAAAMRLLGRFALVLQVCNSLQETSDFQDHCSGSILHFLQRDVDLGE